MTPKKRAPLPETALYEPVRDLFTRAGYSVRGEVRGCDLTAVRGDELVVVELKTTCNTSLLIQATTRQKAADKVYVALPRPEVSLRSARWTGILQLLRRLELGLILVRPAFQAGLAQGTAEVALEPGTPAVRRQSRARQQIVREAASRSADYNVGGSVRQALVTAYRERALHIACCLAARGELKPRELRAMGTHKATLSILSGNAYGWFERVSRGVYRLTEQGREGIHTYAHVAAPYVAAIQDLATACEISPVTTVQKETGHAKRFDTSAADPTSRAVRAQHR